MWGTSPSHIHVMCSTQAGHPNQRRVSTTDTFCDVCSKRGEKNGNPPVCDGCFHLPHTMGCFMESGERGRDAGEDIEVRWWYWFVVVAILTQESSLEHKDGIILATRYMSRSGV